MKVEELQVNIVNQNITDLWNDPDNEILEWGFLALPRTLIWLHRPMGITSNELVFIITVHSLNSIGKKNILDREIAGYNFNNFTDEAIEEIKRVVSFLKINKDKRYQWERRCLEKKGYLKTTVAKAKYDMNTKRFVGQGVEYDFTGLTTALKEVKRIIKEKSANRKNKNNESNKKEDSKSATTPPDSKEKKNSEQSKKETTKNNTSKSQVENNAQYNLLLKNFLTAYSSMHKELLNIELNLNKQTRQKEYIIKIFAGIEKKKIYYKDVLDKAKELFLKMKEDKRTSLSFQDNVARAVNMVVSESSSENKTTRNIRSAKDLFDKK